MSLIRDQLDTALATIRGPQDSPFLVANPLQMDLGSPRLRHFPSEWNFGETKL